MLRESKDYFFCPGTEMPLTTDPLKRNLSEPCVSASSVMDAFPLFVVGHTDVSKWNKMPFEGKLVCAGIVLFLCSIYI